MEKRLEEFTDPELSYLAVDLSQDYQMILKKIRVDVMSVIEGLYDVDENIYKRSRKLLLDWMYSIADMQEYNNPKEERPMGYRGSWMK